MAGMNSAVSSDSRTTATFRAARDLLLAHRTDYAAARAGFTWPELDEFNWALDWFDVIAAEHPQRAALRVVWDTGKDESVSYGEMSARSSQVATWLRGHVRHVITEPAHAPKFAGVPGDWTRIVTGDVPGWVSYAGSGTAPAKFSADGVTRASDPLLLYFTSGTTSKPKLVGHTHASYPVGHLSTMYWIGIRPGDVHMNISSPGWAKHAWSNFFAPWNAQATILILNQERFSAEGLLKTIGDCRVTTFCAPPTVWRMLIQADLGQADVTSLREVVGAGEPLNPEVIEQVRAAWGLTIRDGFGQTETAAQVGNTPGQPLKPGSMGRPLPGYPVVLVDPLTGEPPAAAGAPAPRARSASTCPAGRSA